MVESEEKPSKNRTQIETKRNKDSKNSNSVSPFMIIIAVVLSGLVLFFLFLHTFGSSKDPVDYITLGLLTLLVVSSLIPFAKSILLPGGAGVNLLRMDDPAITNANKSVEKLLSQPQREKIAKENVSNVPADNLNRGYPWRTLIPEHPNAALTEVRREIDIQLHRLQRHSGVEISKEWESPSQVLRKLLENNVVTQFEYEAIENIIRACNKAAHSGAVDVDAAVVILRLAEEMRELLLMKINRLKEQGK
jgi:hypothetical protein